MKHAAAVSILACLTGLLGGCVNRAQSTTNQRDVGLLQRANDGDVPEALRIFDDDDLESELEEAMETPAPFWGLVVDEKGNPLADVAVRVTLFDHVLKPFEFPFVGWTELKGIRTDKRGRFKITGRSAGALVVNVIEDGYWQEEEGFRTYRYAEKLQHRNEYELPTASSPATFRLIPKPPDAILEPISTGAISVDLDGTPVGVSYATTSRYGLPPDVGTIQLAVEAGPPNAEGRYDWQCRITVPEGGVQMRRGLFVTEAPADGYGTSLTLGYAADDPDWDHREDYRLFARDRNGIYAYFVLRVRTQNHPFVSLEGVYNPTGARYGQ